MLILDNKKIIGRGTHRTCYLHPISESLCIKVMKSEFNRELLREVKMYKKLSKHERTWEMLPKFYGEVSTNYGIGQVYTLIRDFNGQPSKTLEHYYAINNQSLHQDIRRALDELKQFLISKKVITTSIKARNIVYQLNNLGTNKAIVIDDIGNSEFIPVSSLSSFFARKKINRKWKKFDKEFISKLL